MAVLEVYPMENEILNLDNDRKCNICDRSFSNVSALRLHRVKTHKIVESIEDKRIFFKSSDGLARTFVFHCPVEKCRERKIKFHGMRNLKQHYLRVHTEKTLVCECGTRFSLQKDFAYHKKSRCLSRDLHAEAEEIHDDAPYISHKKSRLPNNKSPIPQQDSKLKFKETNALFNSPQPIILIVPTEDVQSTIEQISSSFRSTCEVAVQAQTPSFIPQTSTIGVGNEIPQSYDFGGQYNYLQPQDSYYSSHPPEMNMNTGEAGYESYDPLLSEVCCPY